MSKKTSNTDSKRPARQRGLTGRQVYEEIKQLIRSRKYDPTIPLSESEVSRELNVSRTPVREALLRLKSEGWLSDFDGQGLVLRVISDAELQDSYVIREALEEAAARLAAQNGTQAELLALQEIARQFADAVGNEASSEELDTLNARFHRLMYRSSHSSLLARIVEPLHLATSRVKRSVYEYPERPRESADEHVALAEALISRDAGRAGELARAHVRRGGEVRSLLIAERLVSQTGDF